jgi:hypothetical protein
VRFCLPFPVLPFPSNLGQPVWGCRDANGLERI